MEQDWDKTFAETHEISVITIIVFSNFTRIFFNDAITFKKVDDAYLFVVLKLK
jgi:hypothetical protein